jgi:PAS domain S-box-containing protein
MTPDSQPASLGSGGRKGPRGLTISQKGLLVVGVPVVFQAILLFSLFTIERAHDRDRAADRRSKEAIASGYRLLGLMVDAETGIRGYALTGNPAFTQPYDRAIVQIPAELENLKALAASTAVREPEALAAPVLAYLRTANAMIHAGRRDEVVAIITKQVGKNLMDRFRAGMDRFIAVERLLNAGREQAALRARSEITTALVLGGVLNIALAGFLATFFTMSITGRLRVVTSNLERFERNEPLQEPIEGRDEIGQLDARFHELAAALKAADEQWRVAEENLRRFFTISLEMLCIAGFDGVFKLLNPSWEKVLGHPLHEMYSRPFIDFVHPDDREATMAEAQRIADGALTIRFENRYRCADGSYRWLLWNAVGVQEAGLIYAAATDITERKQSEELLQQHNAALESANRELDSFSYSVSHDLRAPLRAVGGYARILDEDYSGVLDTEGRRLLDVVRSEAARMGILIDDLLAFSRLSRQSLGPVDLDLHAMANEIVEELRRNKSDREIEFAAGQMPPAHADRAAIRQVLVNLLSNAVKYAKPTGAIRIEFGGRSNGDHNLYWVRDLGIGFDPRYAEKIFGVFQRLHTDVEFEGSGVGLAIVQRIVQRHGGRVWAESEPGKGAAFFFTLQLAENEIQDGEAINERSGNSSGRG